MTQEKFKEFIKKSGLKKGLVANMIDIPNWVISAWLAGKTVLWELQQKKLDDFCDNFYKNNDYMKRGENKNVE